MKNKSKLVSMVVIMAIIFTTISPIGISRADNWYEDEPGFLLSLMRRK